MIFERLRERGRNKLLFKSVDERLNEFGAEYAVLVRRKEAFFLNVAPNLILLSLGEVANEVVVGGAVGFSDETTFGGRV